LRANPVRLASAPGTGALLEVQVLP